MLLIFAVILLVSRTLSGQFRHFIETVSHTTAPDEHALITVDSFVGRGGHWCYWSTQAADCLPLAALLCWLGDFLAGSERRTLQNCPQAMELAAQWQAELCSPFTCPADAVRSPAQRPAPRRVICSFC